MTSRGEVVISQGWATPSGLRALARIQALRNVATTEIAHPPIDVDIDTSFEDENVYQEPARRP